MGLPASAAGLHAARTVVLVPYAQLMPAARAQWALEYGGGFVPRFETTMNWASSLAGFAPEGNDLSFDMARDRLVAQGLIERAGFAAQQDILCGRVVQAAWQLASAACAQAPAQRSAWAAAMQAAVMAGLESPLLKSEAVVARLALAWAGHSAYATDALFSPLALQSADCLVVLEGLQTEPLVQALKILFADRLIALSLVHAGPQGQINLHAASGPEDEAERAAACVMQHLAAGREPVALAATDRVLTRRTSALLAARGIALRDETGWRLSTTRAAAELMAALRACAFAAVSDAVVDWLKHAPSFASADVCLLEAQLRKTSVRQWQSLPGAWGLLAADEAVVQHVRAVNALRQPMQAARPLLQWLTDLRGLLLASGQWPRLTSDAAGSRVVSALCLDGSAQQVFDGLPHAARRISLAQFTSWVNDVLEAARFEPAAVGPVQVVVLPLAQLLGRPFAALVLPGCDETHLPASPEPPGDWNAFQRSALGMPLRATLQAAARAAFGQALQMPHVDLLWRTADAVGEAVSPSPLVQSLLLAAPHQANTPDPRNLRWLPELPTRCPQPSASGLVPERLSAGAYQDLRRCPYRFFALRQLGLAEVDEIDAELDKRDFGTWLHQVLSLFHQEMQTKPLLPGPQRAQRLDHFADLAARQMGLGDAEFLPFSSAWPQVRDGYLAWLQGHEAQGNVFVQAETAMTLRLPITTLYGRIDRLDRSMQAGVATAYVLDYKTESLQSSRQNVKVATEDTQLLFYAALLPDHELRAAYVNVGERQSETVEQTDVVAARSLLVEGLAQDMQAIADGAALPALGESPACDHCAARGLCRKDFWTV